MNRPITEHPPDEQWVAWRDAPADLAPAARQRLADHLVVCPHCTGRLEELAAVERGLQGWRAALPLPPPWFVGQVLAALPLGLYPRLTWRAWARQQVAGLGCLLAGLVALVLSGDALDGAAQWWQAAWLWLDNAGAGEGEGLTTWLSRLPAGSLEVHLGLLPGALLLGLGALLLLVGNLRGPAVAPASLRERPSLGRSNQ
jgi:hypothetical protein